MKKIVGYFLRTFSILFFIVLSFSIINASLSEDYRNMDAAYMFGYLLGIFLVSALLGWPNYMLFKFSGKLISFKKDINEIDDIGKDDL